MSGLVAVLGGDGRDKFGHMSDTLRYRGPYRRKKTEGSNYLIAALDNVPSNDDRGSPVVLDGYFALRGEGMTYSRLRGEEKWWELWQEQGVYVFSQVEGEFALAMATPEGFLLVARDPLGVKPLYYVQQGEVLYLASEVKALLELEGPVEEVPPGCYFLKGSPDEKWVNYYRLPGIQEDSSLTITGVQDKLERVVFQAVEERIAQENRAGVYLSGGLDSSVVAAAAAELSSEPLYTFAVGVTGSRDLEYARLVADIIGSKHHEYIYDLDEILDVLPDVIYHLESFDCAYIRSSVPNFIAGRLAREEGREVMLTGEGSDEIFAGYSYLKEMTSPEEINREIGHFLKNLSTTGLQRVDRMNSAHGLNCRIPFLNLSLLELALKIPLSWKLKADKEHTDKWILRKAFEKHLGEKVAWREKQQFDQGSGSSGMLEEYTSHIITDEEFSREAAAAPVPVRNKEELYYYRIFNRFFPEKALTLVGRWAKTT